MNKKWKSGCAAALICASLLTGCGGSGNADAVSVQKVSDITNINVSGNNRYSGIVEAQKKQKIKKNGKKTIKKCYVKEGDTVHKGEPLFSYDTASIRLEIESAALELERIKNEIASYDTQIAELEKERKNASANEKLSYSLEIQSAQLDKAEAQYNYKKKQNSYQKLKNSLNNTTVYAKMNGVVQSVANSDSESNVYITILQTGSYRVKGTVSEMNVGSLSEGSPVEVISRLDEKQRWAGTISRINTDGSSQKNEDDEISYNDDENQGESSTKYKFYVDVDNSNGLLLGQHVYIQLGSADENKPKGIPLSSGYLVQDEDGSWYVWKSEHNKLQKQTVTLGDYNEFNDTYDVTEGLAEDDFIAFPEDSLAEGEKTVKYDAAAEENKQGEADTQQEGWSEGNVPAME